MKLRLQKGFTLIETIIVIIVIGIIAGVAVMKMSETLDTARYEHTKEELDQLARAIVGNPDLYSNGSRTDFGYVGDVGALPFNLDALAANPGGYTTWNGPYISQGFANDDFKRDGWNSAYVYADTLIRSVGSGSPIDKVFATNSTELINNRVTGYISDANYSRPNNGYNDSLRVLLTYPDGAGSVTTAAYTPDKSGYFSFNGIPIGRHLLRVIFIPDNDTARYNITVYPGETVSLDINLPEDLF